jgi:hypothetical protein
MAPMLRSRENQIVLEFSFWEAAEEVKDPEGLYELRSYRLKVSIAIESVFLPGMMPMAHSHVHTARSTVRMGVSLVYLFSLLQSKGNSLTYIKKQAPRDRSP